MDFPVDINFYKKRQLKNFQIHKFADTRLFTLKMYRILEWESPLKWRHCAGAQEYLCLRVSITNIVERLEHQRKNKQEMLHILPRNATHIC